MQPCYSPDFHHIAKIPELKLVIPNIYECIYFCIFFFKAALQKTHDFNYYNILLSAWLIVRFSKLELGDNIL